MNEGTNSLKQEGNDNRVLLLGLDKMLTQDDLIEINGVDYLFERDIVPFQDRFSSPLFHYPQNSCIKGLISNKYIDFIIWSHEDYSWVHDEENREKQISITNDFRINNTHILLSSRVLAVVGSTASSIIQSGKEKRKRELQELGYRKITDPSYGELEGERFNKEQYQILISAIVTERYGGKF